MFVCICHAINDKAITAAIKRGCTSYASLQQELMVGSCCGSCQSLTEEILQDTLKEAAIETPASEKAKQGFCLSLNFMPMPSTG